MASLRFGASAIAEEIGEICVPGASPGSASEHLGAISSRSIFDRDETQGSMPGAEERNYR
ncbi:hypothetical protein N8198_03545 [Gammaproteobacteria bacterium]|nr:hypothetical protein [Gammaproteobacteria bacterium]